MSSHLISIIIVNWNGWRDTVSCIDSIVCQDITNVHIIVVDNGSEDNSFSQMNNYLSNSANDSLEVYSYFIKKIINRQSFIHDITLQLPSSKPTSSISLLKLPENTGFANGNNCGVWLSEVMKIDNIILLNNDVEVSREFIEIARGVFTKNNVKKLMSGLIYYYKRRNELWSAGGYWNKWKINGYMYDKYNGNRNNSFLTACCWFINTDIFREVGYFNKGLYLYMEDVEYCLRLKDNKYSFIVIPDIKVYHKVNSSSNKISNVHEYFSVRNRIIVGKKYSSLIWLSIYVLHQLIGSILNQQRSFSVTMLAVRHGIKYMLSEETELYHLSKSFVYGAQAAPGTNR